MKEITKIALIGGAAFDVILLNIIIYGSLFIGVYFVVKWIFF